MHESAGKCSRDLEPRLELLSHASLERELMAFKALLQRELMAFKALFQETRDPSLHAEHPSLHAEHTTHEKSLRE